MKININSQEYEVQARQTILQAARANGVYIPSLCYHPKTGPAAKCRVCVVEIEGLKSLQTACTVEVKEGMRLITNSEKIRQAQRLVVDLLLSTGKHDCLSCEQNGQCELQEAAYLLGIEKPSFQVEEDFEKDASSEFVLRDHAKCIQCGRCVAGCNTTVVNEVLDFGYRNHEIKIVCDDDKPMGNSSCVQCGECVQLCPVGALIDKRAQGKGRAWELKKTETICPYCGVGCMISVHVDQKTNQIVRVTGVEDGPANAGMLCVKGRYGFDFVNSPERLTTPLIKDENGVFQKASWEQALTLVAKHFKEIKEKHGSDSLGGFASAKCTNEENYVFQKFVRKELGTNNVDHCARLCHASTVAGLASCLGSGAMTNDIAGIKAADVILIIGSNTTEAHPVIGSVIKQAVRHGKSKLIVIDPKKIPLSDMATLYAAHRCGTDVAVLNGIMHVIIKNGWEDKEYIKTRCEGFEDLKAEVQKYTPEYVEKISGVPAKTLEEIAALFGQAKTASLFYSMGITQHTTGTDNVWSTANLQMLCGNLGKIGGGVNPLRGQSNVQGACDMGALPVVYTGYQKVVDEPVQKKFEAAWNTTLSNKPGLPITCMIDEAYNGKIKALYIMGENPMLSDPDLHHVEKALNKLDFLVVQDIFLTETAKLANVVLPAASFAEKNGTYTNTERRVQLLRKAVPSPGQARSDWEIVQDLARALGAQDWNYTTVEDIQKEILALTPSYAGISYERMGRKGLHWPCPSLDHPGTPVLHTKQFTRGLGLMKGIPFKEPAELPGKEYPLIMTTGRLLEQFHTGTMTRKTEGLNRLAGPMVMISVEDAEALGIGNGEKVKVSTRRGTITAPAFVTKRIGKGTIFIPFHFAESPANQLTINALDPVAKIPEFKVCAANVSKL